MLRFDLRVDIVEKLYPESDPLPPLLQEWLSHLICSDLISSLSERKSRWRFQKYLVNRFAIDGRCHAGDKDFAHILNLFLVMCNVYSVVSTLLNHLTGPPTTPNGVFMGAEISFTAGNATQTMHAINNYLPGSKISLDCVCCCVNMLGELFPFVQVSVSTWLLARRKARGSSI
jgi:hypothetical protein